MLKVHHLLPLLVLAACAERPPDVSLLALEVEPDAVVIAPGASRQLEATGIYSDGSRRALTSEVAWASSDATVATVDDKGEIQAIGPGQATITAAMESVEGRAVLTVTAAELTGLSIASSQESVPAGAVVELTATGTWSDGRTSDLTSQAQWSSSDESVAAITAPGTVQTLQVGSTRIQATFEGAGGTVREERVITVVAAPLPSLVIPAGAHSFDTSTGALTLEGQSSAVAAGWNDSTKELELKTFALEAEAVLRITGTEPLRVVALEDVTLAGTIDARGEDGADGSAGGGNVPAGHGQAGGEGRSVSIVTSADLVFTGVIDVRGGQGGRGGEIATDYGSGVLTSGDGGNGGDAGTVSLAADGNLTEAGSVLADGGAGGDGGDISIDEVLLTPSPTTSGRGGAGGAGATGGDGGRGGDISVGFNVHTPNTVLSGDGGAGGPGTHSGGSGGRAGKIRVVGNVNGVVEMAAGTGGPGGFGPTRGGDGGQGGDIEVQGNALPAVRAGDGGAGGDSDLHGGVGGDGGSVTVGSGSPGSGGAGGAGGRPNGATGQPGTP